MADYSKIGIIRIPDVFVFKIMVICFFRFQMEQARSFPTTYHKWIAHSGLNKYCFSCTFIYSKRKKVAKKEENQSFGFTTNLPMMIIDYYQE